MFCPDFSDCTDIRPVGRSKPFLSLIQVKLSILDHRSDVQKVILTRSEYLIFFKEFTQLFRIAFYPVYTRIVISNFFIWDLVLCVVSEGHFS